MWPVSRLNIAQCTCARRGTPPCCLHEYTTTTNERRHRAFEGCGNRGDGQRGHARGRRWWPGWRAARRTLRTPHAPTKGAKERHAHKQHKHLNIRRSAQGCLCWAAVCAALWAALLGAIGAMSRRRRLGPASACFARCPVFWHLILRVIYMPKSGHRPQAPPMGLASGVWRGSAWADRGIEVGSARGAVRAAGGRRVGGKRLCDLQTCKMQSFCGVGGLMRQEVVLMKRVADFALAISVSRNVFCPSPTHHFYVPARPTVFMSQPDPPFLFDPIEDA